jgi:hypothetical protein
MGHIRLGTIPKSQPWRNVVTAVITNAVVSISGVGGTGYIGTVTVEGDANPTRRGNRQAGSEGPGGGAAGAAGGAGAGHSAPARAPDPELTGPESQVAIGRIAAKTLDAAALGLERAVTDEGLRYTFYLLTQLALASRSDDWLSRLKESGIELSAKSSLLDLTSAFQLAVDDHLVAKGLSSDVAEIAQRAAGEALCSLAVDKANTLFGHDGDELRHAIRPLSTRAGFGALGQTFFGTFLTHYLNFYLSRITASEIGRGAIQDVSDITRFNSALARHCEQSAAIVRDFAGQWYSKTEYLHGISPKRTAGFLSVAIRKLQAELRSQWSST